MVNKRKLTLDEVVDLVLDGDHEESSDEDSQAINIVVLPPEERANAVSDEDSDQSDDDAEGDLLHLPPRILRNETENDKRSLCDAGGDNNDTFSVKKKKPSEYIWSKDPANQVIHHRSDTSRNGSLDVTSPVHTFQEYFDTKLVNMIASESNRYAKMRGWNYPELQMEDILLYSGVVIFSGYHKLPRRRMYWEQKDDCNVSFISDNIRRDKFERIHKSLHFADNSEIDDDRLFKVRPIFDIANSNFKKRPVSNVLSIDEQMLKYYGHHSSKQFIRGKPVRYGFKSWSICTPEGYVYHSEPYCGSSTRIPKTGLGNGPDVVLGLLDYVNVPKQTFIYFDNYFTSLPLIEQLSHMEIGATGTLRENMSRGLPLLNKNDMKKTERGFYDACSSDDLQLVRWHDNNVVTMVSNCHSISPLSQVARFSRSEKKRINVTVPHAITMYNRRMGGADMADTYLGMYCFAIRSKKWWWPFFKWLLKTCLSNAYLTFKFRENGRAEPIDFLSFTRTVATFLISKFGSSGHQGKQVIRRLSRTEDLLRYDGVDHWTEVSEKPNARCKHCGRRTKFICSKCKIPCHPECMRSYHN